MTAVKRLQKEYDSLNKNPSSLFHAAPLENNIFEWHFTLKGMEGTNFQGGLYHGSIILPENYPMSPGDIIFQTVNHLNFIIKTKNSQVADSKLVKKSVYPIQVTIKKPGLL
jgi:ubiquitin-protein ligase